MTSETFNIASQMAILFGILAIGYFCKKIGFLKPEIDRALSSIILSVPLPAMILASVLDAASLPDMTTILIAFGVGCISYIGICAIAFAVAWALRIHDGHKGVFRFMMIFGNVGFMGFPVINAIYGQEALIYAAMFNLPFNFLCFTLGAWLIASDNEGEQSIEIDAKTFITPANVASLLAMILALVGLCNVPVLGDGLSTLGNMTTPAALLIVGSNMANMPARELLGGPKLWVAGLVKLAVTPLVLWLVMSPLGLDPIVVGVLVVVSAMPVANNGTMLCFQYGGDAKTIAQATFTTTLASIVSIPLLVMFMG